MLDDIPTAAQLRDDLRRRIATLERERDEARAAYCALRDFATEFESEETVAYYDKLHPDKPEWRKGGA